MPEFRSNLFQPETISEGTIHRLSLYSRLLATLEGEGTTVVSSREFYQSESISLQLRFGSVGSRLSSFGQFGKRGIIGYEVSGVTLRRAINLSIGILGVHIRRKVALVGVGNSVGTLVK